MAKCIHNINDLVAQKSKRNVVLRGLQANQSYLVTSLHQWQIVEPQGGQQYQVTQVSAPEQTQPCTVSSCAHTVGGTS